MSEIGRIVSGSHVSAMLQQHAADVQSRPFRIAETMVTGDIDLSRQDVPFDVEIIGCEIDGILVLDDFVGRSVKLTRSTIRAVTAARMRLEGDFDLVSVIVGTAPGEPQPLLDQYPYSGPPTRRAPSDAELSALMLGGVEIGGDLVLRDATLYSHDQWSLVARQIQVEGSIDASRMSSNGSLFLRAARVGGSISLDGSRVGGIDATGAYVRLGFYADWHFRSEGLVRLRSAVVGDVVTFHEAIVDTLVMARLKVPRLRLSFSAAPTGRLVLRDAQIDSIVDSMERWPLAGQLDVEGLAYRRIASVEGVDVRCRLMWLALDRTAGSDSYEQLAQAYGRAGDERSARIVRHSHQRNLHRRARLSTRIWGLVQDSLFGYGYAPGRALVWLLLLVMLGSVWFQFRRPRPLSLNGPAWDAILYSLDLIVPFANLGQRDAWDPSGIDRVIAVTLILSGWVLASAVLAGLARLLNRR